VVSKSKEIKSYAGRERRLADRAKPYSLPSPSPRTRAQARREQVQAQMEKNTRLDSTQKAPKFEKLRCGIESGDWSVADEHVETSQPEIPVHGLHTPQMRSARDELEIDTIAAQKLVDTSLSEATTYTSPDQTVDSILRRP
jgi:hypothetical protein